MGRGVHEAVLASRRLEVWFELQPPCEGTTHMIAILFHHHPNQAKFSDKSTSCNASNLSQDLAYTRLKPGLLSRAVLAWKGTLLASCQLSSAAAKRIQTNGPKFHVLPKNGAVGGHFATV